MRKILIFIIVLTPFFTLAQELGGGVRLGLNINRMTGPKEANESFDSNTGFLVGGLLDFSITDLFGLRGEFLFSQKGGRLLYKGAATQFFNPNTEDQVIAIGERNSVIRVNNSYIDIPIMAYLQPIKKVKIFAGASFGFLVASNGFGELQFNGQSIVGQVPIDFTITQDHLYLKDEGFATAEITNPITFSADGATISIPQTAGAYVLDFEETGEPMYNKFDVGIIGGVAYYLNSSLFFSAMVNSSLGDISNNEKDIAKNEIGPNESRVLRDDVDRNLAIQLSLGFEF